MSSNSLWKRYCDSVLRSPGTGIWLDVSRMRFSDDFLGRHHADFERAHEEMAALEGGAIANPDEGRMVGNYWLRNPTLAPTAELRKAVEENLQAVLEFATRIHDGELTPPLATKFTDMLLIGIGGSALGPQFVADALTTSADRIRCHYFDNTDPDGFDKVLAGLSGRLERTLVVVISKSGGTKETRNGMLFAEAVFRSAGLDFSRQAVAITGVGSELDRYAEENEWMQRFPMWDWVGGRTSIMSAVGLVPMALQGLDVLRFLEGARVMDRETREALPEKNIAMRLAAMWFYAGDGCGTKAMVVLPYKDRLALFSKYLQQLVMESLGKSTDLSGKTVHQGITVYGNKGSTDQHAYVQQLRDGLANFFVTFIEVRRSRRGGDLIVEEGEVTAGDYLQGFLRGTRAALYESGRESITLSLPEVSAFELGALVALYERAVGFYGSLIRVNAYHQPGVEAGKLAAKEVLTLQKQVVEYLKLHKKAPFTAAGLAGALGAEPEAVFHILHHLAVNYPHCVLEIGDTPENDRFQLN